MRRGEGGKRREGDEERRRGHDRARRWQPRERTVTLPIVTLSSAQQASTTSALGDYSDRLRQDITIPPSPATTLRRWRAHDERASVVRHE